MKSICVFCGSSNGAKPEYKSIAVETGRVFAEQRIKLIYGGSDVGLMGAIADSVLENGGEVIGILPEFLSQKEIAHKSLTELKLVNSMHERKEFMAELADGFIVLPGGFGTLDELFEILTWAQLGLHQKPIGILNVTGFFDILLELSNTMVAEGFVRNQHAELLIVDKSATELLEKMRVSKTRKVEKWIQKPSTWPNH